MIMGASQFWQKVRTILLEQDTLLCYIVMLHVFKKQFFFCLWWVMIQGEYKLTFTHLQEKHVHFWGQLLKHRILILSSRNILTCISLLVNNETCICKESEAFTLNYGIRTPPTSHWDPRRNKSWHDECFHLSKALGIRKTPQNKNKPTYFI